MSFSVSDTLAVLERTPDALREQLAGLPAEWTDARPDAENWSAYQVVCHLAYIEEFDWLVRARMILEQGPSQAFPPVSHDDQSGRFQGQSLEQVLGRFAELRRASLEGVRPLFDEPGVLDRRGRHPTLGEVTMRELLATWVVHDLNHLAQAQEAMAHRYRSEVGPWLESLGILTRSRA